ncbi:MAG: V-type ATP synthase subunit F, partial [Clostridia bacterium]|nr:V-type ATP synthase subunit F [Clostridia bacterium]
MTDGANIGVIGDYESICGFSAVGFDIFPVEAVEQAQKQLKALANSGYGIIYITEQYMRKLEAECALYDESATPCIVPI